MKTKFNGILALLLVLVVQLAFAQEKTISGTVSDDTGLPLPGVNIIIKGTTSGTQSDFDGKYTINAAMGQTLVYSYVGFETQEIAVGTSNNINVSMQAGSMLEEVVVTALGITRDKKSLGYATQQVSSEELNETRPTSALGSLSGKVAGVSISTPSGGLGGSTRILLRGASSITQENKPLIVVDGVPIDNSNFNTTATQQGTGGRDYGDASFDINPDDVESVNVLKGGAAAALYGSRAANGVILITTKSGKAGKATISVNTGITFDHVSVLPKIQKLYGAGAGDSSTIEQEDTFSTAIINGVNYNLVSYAVDASWGPRYNGQQVLGWDNLDPEFPADYLNPREWKYPDHDSEDLYNTGMTRNNGVSFSQGTEKAQMRLSVNNSQTTGILPNTKLDRTTVNFNGNAELSDRLKFDAGVNFTSTDGFNRPAAGYTGAGVIQQLYHFGQTSLDYERLKKYKLPDGTQRTWNRTAYDDAVPAYTDNPYWTLYENTAQDKRTRWFGNVGTQYNITDNFYAVGKIYGDTYGLRIQERTAEGSQEQSSYSNADRTFQELNYEGRLHFDKNLFNDKLSVNTFVGGARRDVETHRVSGNTEGGLAAPGIYNLQNSISNPTVTQFDSRKRVNSVFASVSLGYDGILFVSATGRNDWSSTLPADNNSYFYPSLNGSFVFSQLIDAGWLSFGKIRGGVARVGNDTDAYNLNNTFLSDGPFLGNIQFQNSSIKLNPNLRPEFVDTWEAGLEMSFVNRRFGFDVTYYDQVTTDLITPVQVDPSTGYRSTFTNAGKLSNKGVELLVNISPVRTDDFSWDFTFNFAKNKNELLELLPGVKSLELARFPFNGVTLNAVVGESYGQIVGTNYVFDDQGRRVVDADGHYLETKKVENLGSVLPDYTMGFRNSVSYKGVSLSFLIDVQEGGVYRSLTNLWGHYSGILESTVANNIREEGILLDGVTGDVTYNDDGSYTVSNTAPNTTVIPAQAWAEDFYLGNDAQNVFDASYVKLREVALSYSLPKKLTGNLDGITLSVFGRNLATWGLSNDNFDPEIATSGSGNIQGSEGGSIPSTRSIGFNVELKF